MRNGKVEKHSNGIWLMAGIFSAVMICITILSVVASLLLTGRIKENSGMLVVFPTLFVSSLIGNCVASKLNGVSMQMVPLVTGIIIIIMLIGGLVIDGQFSDIVRPVLAVISGGVVACILCRNRKGKMMKRKKRYSKN